MKVKDLIKELKALPKAFQELEVGAVQPLGKGEGVKATTFFIGFDKQDDVCLFLETGPATLEDTIREQIDYQETDRLHSPKEEVTKARKKRLKKLYKLLRSLRL